MLYTRCAVIRAASAFHIPFRSAVFSSVHYNDTAHRTPRTNENEFENPWPIFVNNYCCLLFISFRMHLSFLLHSRCCSALRDKCGNALIYKRHARVRNIDIVSANASNTVDRILFTFCLFLVASSNCGTYWNGVARYWWTNTTCQTNTMKEKFRPYKVELFIGDRQEFCWKVSVTWMWTMKGRRCACTVCDVTTTLITLIK